MVLKLFRRMSITKRKWFGWLKQFLCNFLIRSQAQRVWLSLQYLSNKSRLKLMQNFNIFHGAFTSNPTTLFFYSSFPSFNYCYQIPLQGLNLLQNQNSSLFYLENELLDNAPPTCVSTDSQPVYTAEEQGKLPKKNEKINFAEDDQKSVETKRRIERKSGKNHSDQKDNRNVSSNILRNFFRKVNDPSKIERLVGTIISRNKLSITTQEFLEYVKRLKVNHSKYLRFKKLRHLFVDLKHAEHSLIFRALYQFMADGELLIQSLTSRKIGRWSVPLHLKGARELKEKLYGW